MVTENVIIQIDILMVSIITLCKLFYLCNCAMLKARNMATPIKAVPILTGELAEEFIFRAEENERKPRREASPERQKEISDFLKRSKEYVPSWRRRQ